MDIPVMVPGSKAEAAGLTNEEYAALHVVNNMLAMHDPGVILADIAVSPENWKIAYRAIDKCGIYATSVLDIGAAMAFALSAAKLDALAQIAGIDLSS